jgi:hypothetical protein
MAVTWTVTGVLADQTNITTAGQVVTGKRVYFQTGEGNRDSVFVPDDQYKPATVKTLVQAAAALADQVSTLHSGAS